MGMVERRRVDRIGERGAALKCRLAAMRFEASLRGMSFALKAGFRPSQPRAPRGRPDGGRWVPTGGEAPVHLVAKRPGIAGFVRIGGRPLPMTALQQMRVNQSDAAMREAIRDLRRLEPRWKPPAQAYETVEGLISANRTVEQAARFRLFELRRTGAELGPYAREWIPAPPTNRRLNRAEQREVDRLGRTWGCHRCGTKDPGGKRGSFVGDHQVPKSIGTPTRIYPHCFACSSRQGGLLGGYLRSTRNDR